MEADKSENKKKLKRQRTREYFLDAAKELVENEGVESVSVRRVADDAGYSFATLYKYFADLNELLWDVKQAMILDFAGYMQEKMPGVLVDGGGMKSVFQIYTDYFFQHPNVFKFFYFHRLIPPHRPQEEAAPDFDAMSRQAFLGYVRQGKLKEQDVDTVARTCIYTVHGMLTLFFSGNGDLTETSLQAELARIIDYLLKQEKEN